MDFRSLCKKVDMDSLRAKMPPMPTLPHINLPKSMSKLKGHKIFCSSCHIDNVAKRRPSPTKRQQRGHREAGQMAYPSPAEFIDHSPTRISTISSLIHKSTRRHHYGGDEERTYRRADSIDDFCPSAASSHAQGLHRQLSTSPPHSASLFKSSSSESKSRLRPNARKSITEKLQKGYKDLRNSEFRLKHIFGRRTVVRKDNIEVDHYVVDYAEERRREEREQQLRDREIADNYKFNFTVSRQNTVESSECSRKGSPTAAEMTPTDPSRKRNAPKSVGEHSGDESGMDTTPPKRRPHTDTDTARTRFKEVRKSPPLSQSITDEEYSEREEANIAEFTNGLKDSRHPASAMGELKKRAPPLPGRRKGPANFPLSKANDFSSTSVEDNLEHRYRPQSEDRSHRTKVSSKEEPAGHLRRFISTDHVDTDAGSPKHATLTNRLQAFTKSFKRHAIEDRHTEAEPSESPRKRDEQSGGSALMRKLKYLRARKQPDSTDDPDDPDDPDDDEEWAASGRKRTDNLTARAKANLEQKFERARHSTAKMMNEKMQQMRRLYRSHDEVDATEDTKKSPEMNATETGGAADPSPSSSLEDHDEKEEYTEEIANDTQTHEGFHLQREHVTWTTKPILSNSMESLDDDDGNDDAFPRVLIHQDESDLFESKLVIAVTSGPVSLPPALLVPADQSSEAWKVPHEHQASLLYKARSINLFETTSRSGGALRAFEDFDDELRNAPVFSVATKEVPTRHADSLERDSSEEFYATDDDNSSCVTRISAEMTCPKQSSMLVQGTQGKDQSQSNTRLPKNSTGKVDRDDQTPSNRNLSKEDEEEEYDEDEEEDDRPPSTTPSSPPPSPSAQSAAPPPLPPRQSAASFTTRSAKSLNEVLLSPTSPVHRSPQIPERSVPMNRTKRPLVKTASLRLSYNEQVKPDDVGKVNKLISRFECNDDVLWRPKVILRKQLNSNDSLDYSEDDESGGEQDEVRHVDVKTSRDATPTPARPALTKAYSIDHTAYEEGNTIIKPRPPVPCLPPPSPPPPATSSVRDKDNNLEEITATKWPFRIPLIAVDTVDCNFNYSDPSPEYGSPLTYPSSLSGSQEATPTACRKEPNVSNANRSRRSMTRDEENFYSFDSDEENSFYSMSSTSSHRGVVDL